MIGKPTTLKLGPMEFKSAVFAPERLDFALEFKAESLAADTGEFEGYVAIFNTEDQKREIIRPGAFRRTLAHWSQKGFNIPLLWNHDPDKPIGVILEAKEDDKGLWVRGRFLLELKQAQETWALVKANVVRGMSIGFKTIVDEWKGANRHLKEIRLYEGSVTTFALHEAAGITEFKAMMMKEHTPEAVSEAVDEIMACMAEMSPAEKANCMAGMLKKMAECMGEETPPETKSLLSGLEGGLEIKAGAVLSASNMGHAKQAYGKMQTAMAAVDEACAAMESLLGSAEKPNEPESKSLDQNATGQVGPSVETLANRIAVESLSMEIKSFASRR